MLFQSQNLICLSPFKSRKMDIELRNGKEKIIKIWSEECFQLHRTFYETTLQNYYIFNPKMITNILKSLLISLSFLSFGTKSTLSNAINWDISGSSSGQHFMDNACHLAEDFKSSMCIIGFKRGKGKTPKTVFFGEMGAILPSSLISSPYRWP